MTKVKGINLYVHPSREELKNLEDRSLETPERVEIKSDCVFRDAIKVSYRKLKRLAKKMRKRGYTDVVITSIYDMFRPGEKVTYRHAIALFYKPRNID